MDDTTIKGDDLAEDAAATGSSGPGRSEAEHAIGQTEHPSAVEEGGHGSAEEHEREADG